MKSISSPVSSDAAGVARRFEQVADSVPLDITARLVVSDGVHYEPSPRSATLADFWFDQCPKLKNRDRGHRNLIGIRNGNLTCVGYYGGGIWVMRCVCGRFKLKRDQRIIHPTNPNIECCIVCRRAEQMRDSSLNSDFTAVRDLIQSNVISFAPEPSAVGRFFKKEPVPNELRWAVWERDNFTCQHCGTRQYLSIDHIIAESKGGLATPDNLQTLCKSCNSRKGAH